MNIAVAPDSFKGSLTAIEVSEIMKKAANDVDAEYKVLMKPMADGGEGTLEAILRARKGEHMSVLCRDALGNYGTSHYGIIDGNTAVIECAEIVGLPQIPAEKRDPDRTTTYGVGEAIVSALDHGCTRVIVALGGSATNDGGLGMLMALGMRPYDANHIQVDGYGSDVGKINFVDFSGVDSRLAGVEISIASDVDNPLCGERGATAVFGPQKGVSEDQIETYDSALHQFGLLVEASTEKTIKDIAGAGAAGGLGFALLALGGEIVSGAELVAEAVRLDDVIRRADLVLTGEGQSDEQTLYGKAPGYVASVAERHGVPVVLISGSLNGDEDALREKFAGCFSIIRSPLTLQACIDDTDKMLYNETKQIVHLVNHLIHASGGNKHE